MSGARNVHPGFLRKVAIVSICGGLAIGAAVYGLRFVPMLIGLSDWASVENRFIPIVDGLFVLGLLAHLAAMAIVVRERNPGIGLFLRRAAIHRNRSFRVVQSNPMPDENGPEGASDSDSSEQPTQPGRMRAAWTQLRTTMVAHRGATETDENESAADRIQLPLLGTSAPEPRDDTDSGEGDDDGR